MSLPLTYLPAYLGLFAAQVLAMTSNAFLDIQYGSFPLEVTLWACAFGLTLALGWSQHGRTSQAGKNGQIIVLVLGVLLTFALFIPLWRFPRAGLAMLATMMAAYNCVTVTRRHLHFGLLITAVMVMFAASHHRADWTMLFYLMPYVVAVVFTLVSEQINRRIDELRRQSLERQVAGGQWAAIAAATATILAMSALLYAITPQWTWPLVQWQHGQLTNIGVDRGPDGQHAGLAGATGEVQPGQNGRHGDGAPSPREMREAAKRPGMPDWQSDAINRIANGTEWIQATTEPLFEGVQQLVQALKDWIAGHVADIGIALLALLIALLLYAMARLLGEAKIGLWLFTRVDYLRLGVLGMHASGGSGARQYYAAMQRLFALYEAERSALMNTREYLALLCVQHGFLHREATEMTRLFEDSHYGAAPTTKASVARMRSVYRQLYQSL